MIQAPANKVIVHPKTKYIQHISDLMKRSSIQNGATVDPSDIVNIVGEIVSLPMQISETKDYEGYSTENLQIGDMAIFSFKVIYDLIIKQEHGEPVYKNLVKYDGKEFFLCDIRNLFGVIRGEDIIMVNGYVMATEFEQDKIIISQTIKTAKKTKSSQVMHIGNNRHNLRKIGANQGDTIFFDGSKVQHYEINKKKFIILQQEKILGRDISEMI